MDYEQFKERIEEDLRQALADHGIDANLSQHHVEKLNLPMMHLASLRRAVTSV